MPTLAVKAVLMKGLTCGYTTACESGTSISAGRFTLFCITPHRFPAQGSGGTRPMMPGEISQMYQPVPEELQYIHIPREQEAHYMQKRSPVIVIFKMGEWTIEKEYMVPAERLKIIVKAINIINVTKDRISVSVKNIKRLYSKIIVKVSNFRREQ